MRKLNPYYKLFLVATILVAVTSSCGGKSNSTNTAVTEVDSIVTAPHESTVPSVLTPVTGQDTLGTSEVASTEDDENNGGRIYFTIPAPEEVLSYITESNFAFNPSLMNPISNQSKYVDSRLKSINLGGYFADVAYTAVFKQPGRSAEYLKAIEEFGVEISVFTSADKQIRERMSANFNNVDSVSNISKEAYETVVDYLFTSNRQKTYALLCVGSYIESMYLALNYADKFHSFTPSMLKKIIEQKLLFDDIYKIMLSQKNDPDIALTIKEIEPLRVSFEKMGFSVSNPSSNENNKGELTISSENKYEYTEGSFTALRNQIFAIRNGWTSN